MINDEGGICISDPLVDVLMRRLTYDTYKPIPAMWYYKSPEELMHATAMGPQADVYSWASLVYEVSLARPVCLITASSQLYTGVFWKTPF